MVPLFLLFLGSHGVVDEGQRFEYSQPHMGTTFRLVMYASSEAKANEAAQKAWQRIKELNQIFSDYEESSELNKLCAQAGQGPIKVSADLFAILQKSEEVWKKTENTFDVSVGPLVHLWRISRKTKQLPSGESLEKAQLISGFDKVVLNVSTQTVELKVPGMRLDLGGIAKGYTADAVLDLLKGEGISSALIAAGGDIAVTKKPPGSEGWKIDIWPTGKKTDQLPKQLLLEDAAVSTSGDAEQFVHIDGKKYSHLIDPRTGLGITGGTGASVIAKKGVDADVHTKFVAILGPKKAFPILETIPGMAAMYFSYADRERPVLQYSNRWQDQKWK